ncbi:hypothetical protein HMPREF9074_07742 [Capnocytophaga sp. oral taxon 329 str. F0087]|nr:hypothetical protein HMPREF9074_07742 [Capnocytophaga sp. oral taxon 329 str. F0087]
MLKRWEITNLSICRFADLSISRLEIDIYEKPNQKYIGLS